MEKVGFRWIGWWVRSLEREAKRVMVVLEIAAGGFGRARAPTLKISLPALAIAWAFGRRGKRDMRTENGIMRIWINKLINT